MKVAFLIQDGVTFFNDDLELALKWFKEKTPLEIEYDIIPVKLKLSWTMFKQEGPKFWMGTYKVKEQIRDLVPENKYHVVCFVYDRSVSTFYNIPNFEVGSWTFFKPLYDRTEYTELALDKDLDARGWSWQSICHEFMHAFVKRVNRLGRNVLDEMDVTIVNGKSIPYYLNHDPYAKDGNFAHTIENLEGYWDLVNYMPTTWKYFTANEVKGLKTELVDLLDKAREKAGIPFVLTSTVRSKAENEAVGGVSDSSHLTGQACDISAKTSQIKYKIVTALLAVGFTRIGVGKDFVHADIDKEKPQEVMWTY